MKITRYKGDTNPTVLTEINDIIDGHVCPCCGERKMMYSTKKGRTKGIYVQGYRTTRKGCLFKKTYRVLKYHCYTCDTSWDFESCCSR